MNNSDSFSTVAHAGSVTSGGNGNSTAKLSALSINRVQNYAVDNVIARLSCGISNADNIKAREKAMKDITDKIAKDTKRDFE